MKYINFNHSSIQQPTLGGLGYWAEDCLMINSVREPNEGLS